MLGSTDISVNEIGYGAMHLSIDADKRPTEEESIALIRRAVDELGVNFIDTADAYCLNEEDKGHNERLIAKALDGGRGSHVLVATKGGCTRPEGRWERNGHPDYIRAACEASLRALNTERIDLYQLHAPDATVPVEETLGTLADLQREGKIRHVGVSNFSLDLLQRGMKEVEIISLQNQYMLMNRRDEDGIVDFCEEHKITYIPWNPIGGRGNAPQLGEMFDILADIAAAHGASPHAIALAWLLQRSPAIIPIPGTRSTEHLAQNMKASEIELSGEEIERLESIGV